LVPSAWASSLAAVVWVTDFFPPAPLAPPVPPVRVPAAVPGVGEKKLETYGEAVLEVVADGE